MRIGLFNEGTYPVTAGGGVTRWCEQLIGSLPEHTFVPITLIGSTERVACDLADNVADTTLIPLWGPVRPTLLPWRRRRLEELLERLWSAALPGPAGTDTDVAEFALALRALTQWSGPRLARMLAAQGSARALLAAWRTHRAGRPALPPLTLAEAVAATVFVDRVIALADVGFPPVEVSHLAANGPCAVLALGRLWSQGTPILLTEHGIYLRERYLGLATTRLSWSARRAVTAFVRALSQVTYAEAERLTPVSQFNARWAISLGADPEVIQPIPNAVETDRFAAIPSEPAIPTVAFVGRINPLKDLGTLIRAVALVRQDVPLVRLRLFGPVPEGNEEYRQELDELIAELGLGETVSFEGKVPSAVPALEAGHVIALSSISEGLPFTVIEAMMAGRATVSTDVGGVGEVVGTDGSAGVLVPPRDPAAFAEALTELLTERHRRRAMGERARARAQALFDLDRFTDDYRDAYRVVAGVRGPAVAEPV